MNKTTSETNEPNQEQLAIERLRQSKTEMKTEQLSNGQIDGREFVLTDDDADAACQRRLERAAATGIPFNSFRDLAKVLAGDYGTEDDWQEIFQANYGNEIEEPEWMEGFMKGALEKFRELEAKL